MKIDGVANAIDNAASQGDGFANGIDGAAIKSDDVASAVAYGASVAGGIASPVGSAASNADGVNLAEGGSSRAAGHHGTFVDARSPREIRSVFTKISVISHSPRLRVRSSFFRFRIQNRKILTVASSPDLQFRTVILIFAGKFELNLRW